MLDNNQRCKNFNHSRSPCAPVRNCSMCGEEVNATIEKKACTEEEHLLKQIKRDRYCIDCGTMISQPK